MNNYQLELLANIYATVTRVEGMKAENQASIVKGYSGVYGEDHFKAEANHLEYLANRALTLPE